MNTCAGTKEVVRSHWDNPKTAESYERQRYGNIHRILSHYLDCDAIVSFLKNNFSNTATILLDMACGTARLTRGISRPNRKIISADYSARMLLEAKKKLNAQFSPVRPVRCDGFHLPFGQGTFDAVFTIRFIRHYRELERIRIYSEINRILKNNGILIFDVLNKDIDIDAHRRSMYDETYSLDDVASELRENGFILSDRLAGNITKDPLFVIFKKWSLIPLGRWYAKKIRSRKIHLDNATFWMVCAEKNKP